jgi:hypothetical protein
MWDRSKVCVRRVVLRSFYFDLALAQMSPTAKKIYTHTSFYKYELNELKGKSLTFISLVNNILHMKQINLVLRSTGIQMHFIMYWAIDIAEY